MLNRRRLLVGTAAVAAAPLVTASPYRSRRRVFYVDAGDLPPEKARAYLQRVAAEAHARRIMGVTHA